jgi:hypothetical protein
MSLTRDQARRDGASASEATQYRSRGLDPLHRSVPTPHVIILKLMGKTVRLESNSLKILDLALQFFASYPQMSQGDPELTWRIVIESGGVARPAASTAGFSDADLSFVNLGQRSFLAMDAEARSGIGFLAEEFAEVLEPKFATRPPLEFLFYMSAKSLGFTSLSAACVAFGENGVLLLGEPNSGKTTASYVAAMLGMELLADHVVFLECATPGVRAWGEPLPAMFRPEALHFFPELRSQVRALSYGGVSFCFFDKSNLQSRQAHSVMPLCSIFLQRAVAAEPRLVPMPHTELLNHLAASLLFKASQRYRSQHAAVFARLAVLPSYRLSYGEDPATAAAIVRNLLIERAGESNE